MSSSQGLLGGVRDALHLILTGDAEVFAIVAVSLQVAGVSTILASLGGLPLALWISGNRFRGRALTIAVFHTLMGLPTVVVGLLAYSLLSRRGPLGFLDLLYAPGGMILAETLLGLPLVVALGIAALESSDPRIRTTARSLGASRLRTAFTLLSETRIAILAAVAATFGRLISELGIALMVGGNIRGLTRTMTTAIALETSRGDFRLAFALGIILLTVALGVNLGLAATVRRPR